MPILLDSTPTCHTVQWFSTPPQATSEWVILSAREGRRTLRARQYAVLLARQHAVDLETVGNSISPHDVEIIAGLAIDAYAAHLGRRQ